MKRTTLVVGMAAGMFWLAALTSPPASSVMPPVPRGDANCDARVNSIDAILVLQATAGLIDSVPCSMADIDGDGILTSIDAAIILQIGAELCCARLTLEIIVDQPVPFGEPVSITLSITNEHDKPITRTYSSGQLYDFAVQEYFNDIWRWSSDLAFPQVITQQTFLPGETITYSTVWNQLTDEGAQISPGSYDVWGWDVGCSDPPWAYPQCSVGRLAKLRILPPIP